MTATYVILGDDLPSQGVEPSPSPTWSCK